MLLPFPTQSRRSSKTNTNKLLFQKKFKLVGLAWWFMSINPAIQEAEIGGLVSDISPWKVISETLGQENKLFVAVHDYNFRSSGGKVGGLKSKYNLGKST
jgi:hypothetical protein